MSPLANQNPLAQLNDIIAPTAANSWPPAPLYWLLLLLFLAVVAGSIYLIKQLKENRKKQQQALKELQQLEHKSANFIVLNQLIKGVALSYFPRQQVASLHGQQWFDFLQNYAATPLFANKQLFLQRLYTQSQQPCTADDFAQTKIWIKQLPKEIKKQHKKAVNHV